MAKVSTDLMDSRLADAEARGRDMMETCLRAEGAHYDSATGKVCVELSNGCTYIFPARIVQDLEGATDDQLKDVAVDGAGFNLHWAGLDADLYVPALVSGIFGTEAWMRREFARHAGRIRTPAKAAASRANGAKGGRPRKSSQRSRASTGSG